MTLLPLDRLAARPHGPDLAPLLAAAGRRLAWLGGPLGGLAPLAGLVLPFAVLALWAVAAREHWMARQILPAPALVWQTGLDLVQGGDIQDALLVSAVRLVLGFLAGGLLGAALGLAMGLSRTLEAAIGPTVRAVWLVPSIGWLPFLMLVFGIGETLKVVVIAKACALPLMLAAFTAVRGMPERYRDVARVLELGRLATLRHVVLPAVLPGLLTGVRLSLAKGWQVLVLVEMIASAAGIGYLMTWGRKSFQLDVVLVTMVLVGVLGWLLDHGLARLQRRCTAWVERTAA